MSVIINGGGGGGAASFTTLTGGTNTGNSFVLGNGSSISTTGTGTIGAAGSSGQIQFNNGGVLAGDPNFILLSPGGTSTNVKIGSATDNGAGGAGPVLTLQTSSGGGNNIGSGVGNAIIQILNAGNQPIFTVDGVGGVRANGYVVVQGALGAPGTGFATQGMDGTTFTWVQNANANGSLAFSGAWSNTNVTPVTVNANVATDQNLMSVSVPAGTLNRINRSLRVWLSGVYSTPAASTTAVVVKVKLGSLTLATWTSTALAGIQATNDQFNISAVFTVQTAGATAALEGHGNLIIDLGVGNTVADSTFADVNTATVSSVDLTAAQTLQVTIAFTVASGSNTATQRQMVIETIN
jgi:hypothetical protein